MSAAGPVELDRSEGVLTITLARPAVRNAIDAETALAVGAAIDELESSDDLRVAVLTGAGGYFCAGMDLRETAKGAGSPKHPRRGFAGVVEAPPRKPLIAAVEGGAVGGGFEILLACDLIVAAVDARFALPEVRRGRAPGGGGLFRLAARIPRNRALEMIFTGDPIEALDLRELGMINRIVEPGTALAAAQELGRKIAANAPLALAASKQVIELSGGWSDAEAFERQEEWIGPVRTSADAIEGAQAFVEKRPARFRGE